MEYPLQDFLKDYDTWKAVIDALPQNFNSEEARFNLAQTLFDTRYSQLNDKGKYRLDCFKAIFSLMHRNVNTLTDAGLVVNRPQKYGALIRLSLLAALHELWVIKGKANVTIEDIQSSAKGFESMDRPH